jgi:uncharacterized membrane protein
MKSLIHLLRTTLTGGIIFLLPVTLLIIVLKKAFALLAQISAPIARRIPDGFLGLDGSKLIGIFLIVLICFISGLAFRSKLIKRWIGKLEDNVLSLVPGYTLVKSITADAVGEKVDQSLHPVLVQDGDSWSIGFLVEEAEGFCTVFFPEIPRLDSGEAKIVPAAIVKRVNVPANLASRSLRNYGKGALEWKKKD